MKAQKIGGQESMRGSGAGRNPPEERWREEDAHRNPPGVLEEERNLLEHPGG